MGTPRVLTVLRKCKYFQSLKTRPPKDLQVGDRVAIHAMLMKDGMLMAHTIQIGVAKIPPKSH